MRSIDTSISEAAMVTPEDKVNVIGQNEARARRVMRAMSEAYAPEDVILEIGGVLASGIVNAKTDEQTERAVREAFSAGLAKWSALP